MSQNDLIPLCEEFARLLKIRNLSRGTIRGALWRLGKFFDYLETHGITHIDGITKDVVRAFQVELYQCINKKGRPNTISYQNTMLSAVKQFLNFLKEHDYIVSDPVREIQFAKEPKRLPRGVLTICIKLISCIL